MLRQPLLPADTILSILAVHTSAILIAAARRWLPHMVQPRPRPQPWSSDPCPRCIGRPLARSQAHTWAPWHRPRCFGCTTQDDKSESLEHHNDACGMSTRFILDGKVLLASLRLGVASCATATFKARRYRHHAHRPTCCSAVVSQR